MAAVVRRAHGEIRHAAWEQVESVEDDVRLAVPWDRLEPLEELEQP